MQQNAISTGFCMGVVNSVHVLTFFYSHDSSNTEHKHTSCRESVTKSTAESVTLKAKLKKSRIQECRT